ncbi:S8 family serine peptidase [Pasteuria penetrans]|uniref:S8 family serine peptidase n=1 Tax=Pasteuria penetrans TaxID=86005 RepID=UPI0011EFE8D5|nr:S8 family serine peptidase [Pasteuria penetrans]
MANLELLRGGKRISVQPATDRFFVVPNRTKAMTDLASLPGVQSVQRLSQDACLVDTVEGGDSATLSRIGKEAIHVQPTYQSVMDPASSYDVTRCILLSFTNQTTVVERERIVEKFRLKVLREEIHHLVVEVETDRDVVELSCELKESPEVSYAEPNIYENLTTHHQHIPTDSLFPRQWHLHSPERRVQLVPEAGVYAPDAWYITRGSRSIVVSTIDDGFDLQHPDLVGEGKIIHPLDYADHTNDPSAKRASERHGTACAGVAIAEENGRGTVGVAPGCAWMPVRMPLRIDDATLYSLFQTVGRYARVLSCSWGPIMPSYRPIPTSLAELFGQLEQSGGPDGKGCIVCVAAGNDNLPLSGDHYYYLKNKEIVRIERPILNGFAAHPANFTVAATTSLGTRAAYSSWGKEINCCAPSNNANPYNRDYVPGLGIWTTDREPGGYATSSHYTGTFGGTSSATPLVAGIAALVLSTNPHLSAREAKKILHETADKIKDTSPDLCGKYRGDYDSEGHSLWFGYGKINAKRAVETAYARKPVIAKSIPLQPIR